MKARAVVIWTAGGVCLAAVLWLALAWPRLAAEAQVAVGYGAHVACSCHFVGGRSLGSCREDFEPGMGLVRLRVDDKAQSVTAFVPLLASRTAIHAAGYGCTLTPPAQ